MNTMQPEVEFPPAAKMINDGYFEIVSAAAYTPPTRKDTAQLLKECGLSLNAAIIERVTGVESRYIADPEQSDSDLLVIAAQKCLAMAGLHIDVVSKMFVNKLLGDRILPPTSTRLQKKLGATVAFQCMDIDGGTNGFFQALLTAGRCLDAGDELVLIASGGIHQRLMNPSDSRTAFLYGDAATAMLLRASDRRHLLAQYEFSNPLLAHLHHCIDFYHFVPAYFQNGRLDLFAMGNIKEAEVYYCDAARHTMTVLLDSAQLQPNDIDMFLMSQITGPVWKKITDHLGLPSHKLVSLLPETGNTLAAGIPMQLCHWWDQQMDLSGKTVMIISLGEGAMGGGCIYQF